MEKTIKPSLKILHIVKPKEQPEGEGARVCRYIGTQQIRHFDPFLMLDLASLCLPAGFPDHPHRGFATLSYLLSGKVFHEDFKGHKGELGPGDVQVMTPGKGIVHSEMPGSFTEPAIGFQLWLNLKAKEKYCDPDYQEYKSANLPIFEKKDLKVKIVVGSYEKMVSPIKGKTEFEFFDFQMAANSQLTVPIKKGWSTFIVTHKGSMAIDEVQKVEEKDGFFFETNEESEAELNLKTGDKECSFIFVSGEACKEPIFQYGPFVLTTKEELAKAFDDYQMGKNGFEGAREWSSEIKNLKYSKPKK